MNKEMIGMAQVQLIEVRNDVYLIAKAVERTNPNLFQKLFRIHNQLSDIINAE